jgi:hypothetical protein
MATFNDLQTRNPREIVICAICSDLYQDPRLLPCSHTFCFQCIRNSVDDSTFNCPLQDDTKIDQNDIASLPVNRKVKDTVEFMLHVNLASEDKSNHQCQNCTEKAINWCERCAYYYCESCTNTVHSIKAFQSHTVIPSAERMPSFCLEHSDEKFRYWCKQCEVLVCRDCLLFQHKDHTFVSLNNAASDAKVKLQDTMQKLSQIKNKVVTLSETTKGIINQQREIVWREKQDIEQTFSNLQQQLEERKHVMIQQLEDNALQTMNILDDQQAAIDQHLNLTIVHEHCIQKMLDSNDPMRILDFTSNLYKNFDNFEERYTKIAEGYVMKTHLFKKDGRNVEQLSDIISKLGDITITSQIVRDDSVAIKTSRLDISKIGGYTGSISRESNYARGYRFTLKKTLKLRSIQINSDQVGNITSFVVNDLGIIIQKSTIKSTDETMKWLSIPIECDIQNHYNTIK